jgi:hypothetical protein
MTQALYAHMNNKTIKKKRKVSLQEGRKHIGDDKYMAKHEKNFLIILIY